METDRHWTFLATVRVLAILIVLGPAATSRGQTLQRGRTQAQLDSRPAAQPQPRPNSAPQPQQAPAQPSLTPAQQQRLNDGSNQAQRARALAEQGKYPEAIAAAQSWLEALREVHGEGSHQTADALDLLAKLHALNQDSPAELRTRRELADVLKRSLREDNWRVTDSRLDLATCQRIAAMIPEEKQRLDEAAKAVQGARELAQAGQFDAALKSLDHAREMYSDLLGAKHRALAACDVLEGGIWMERKKYPLARSCFEQAVKLRRATLGDHHPHLAEALRSLASVAEAQGDFVEAKVVLEQAISSYRDSMQGDDATTATLLENLGRLLQFHGDENGAQARLEEAARIWQALVPRASFSGPHGFVANLRSRARPTERPSATRRRPSPLGLNFPGLDLFGDSDTNGTRIIQNLSD
jgi:tetratricopeptide (TPR) repeat protein